VQIYFLNYLNTYNNKFSSAKNDFQQMEDFYRQKILSARVALKKSQIKINSLEGLIQTKVF